MKSNQNQLRPCKVNQYPGCSPVVDAASPAIDPMAAASPRARDTDRASIRRLSAFPSVRPVDALPAMALYKSPHSSNVASFLLRPQTSRPLPRIPSSSAHEIHVELVIHIFRRARQSGNQRPEHSRAWPICLNSYICLSCHLLSSIRKGCSQIFFCYWSLFLHCSS
jgi:hypothetical protein